MKQNEPVQALRTLAATIYAADGDLLPSATTWLAGMVQISKDGGAFANATNLPTPVSGGGDGDFDLVLTVSEVDTIGNLRVRFFDDASQTTLLAEYVDQVVTSTTYVPSTGTSTPWTYFGCGVLKSDILAIAPQLTALNDTTWLILLTFINTFTLLKCDPALAKLALSFLGAHLGTITSGVGASGATGAVISESAAGLKRTYAQITTFGSSNVAGLQQTPYGMQYLALLRMSTCVAGPFLL